ncbi:MAG: hypothetical protein ACJ76B_12745 [Solirubrobacterales bacterium]
MLYRAIVKRKARGVFAALSRGDWEAVSADLAEDVHHVFAGDNALGGMAAAGIEEAGAAPIGG